MELLTEESRPSAIAAESGVWLQNKAFENITKPKISKGWGAIVKLLQLVDSFLLSANQKPPFLL